MFSRKNLKGLLLEVAGRVSPHGGRTRAGCKPPARLSVPIDPARVESSTQAAELCFHKVGGNFWNGKPEQVQELSGTMPGGARPSRVEPRRSVKNGAALRRAGL